MVRGDEGEGYGDLELESWKNRSVGCMLQRAYARCINYVQLLELTMTLSTDPAASLFVHPYCFFLSQSSGAHVTSTAGKVGVRRRTGWAYVGRCRK